MKRYKKYYKTESSLIHTENLKHVIRKLFSKESKMVFVRFDFKNYKIRIEDISKYDSFLEWMWSDKSTRTEKIINKIFHFLHYKLKISFRANIKTLNTLLIQHVGIMVLTKETSHNYKKSKAKAQLLTGIIDSSYSKQPVFIHDNICWSRNFPYFLDLLGLHKKSKKIWDVWMESKFTENDRKKFRKNLNEELLKMIEVEK